MKVLSAYQSLILWNIFIIIIISTSSELIAQPYNRFNPAPGNPLTVGGMPINGVHTYGGKAVDKRSLYNPNAEAILGFPLDPDTYTYQYYYTPPYNHNSPYLLPPDYTFYPNSPMLSLPPSDYPSPPTKRVYPQLPSSKEPKKANKVEPHEILPITTSLIDKFIRDFELDRRSGNKKISTFQNHYLKIGNWQGNFSISGSGSGKVYLSNSKGENLTGYFNNVGSSIRYNFDLSAQSITQKWSGNSITYGSGGSVYLSSNTGNSIQGFFATFDDVNRYRYSNNSSHLTVEVGKKNSKPTEYFIRTYGTESISGYLNY